MKTLMPQAPRPVTRRYGRGHLGSIQAAVQVLSVLASATGPVALAACRAYLNGTDPFFFAFAGCSAVVAVLAWVVAPPAYSPQRSST